MTWTAQIQMYDTGFYLAKGSLQITKTIASFDSATGTAVFSDLLINKTGMYLILFKVFTNNKEYSSECFSNPITIKSATAVTTSSTTGTQPDYLLKFNGNYSSINPNEIMANVYNYMSSFNLEIKDISCYSGSVYVAIYSSDYSSTLLKSLATNGLNISSSLVFVSALVDGNTYQCTNCTTDNFEALSQQVFYFNHLKLLS